MAEFRLERFKYNWRGVWTTGTSYKRDDIVRVNGKSYVCVITHVASSTFATDLTAILPGSNPPQPQPKWVVMTNGRSFEGDWNTSTSYNLGDVVVYNGSLWACIDSHTSSDFDVDFDNWEEFANVTAFVGEWQTATTYSPGALVKYNGIIYKCVTAHTTNSLLELDQDSWEVFLDGVEYRGPWQPSTEYRKNDIVKYGGSLFRCTGTHTSNPNSLDSNNFVLELPGFEFDNDWSSTVYYNQGDVVRHKGTMYIALKNNYNSRPYTDNTSEDWGILSKTFSFRGNWSIDASYKTGDVVLRGGNLYQAQRDLGVEYESYVDPQSGETLQRAVSTALLDGSSTDYLEEDTWKLIIPGKSYKGIWKLGNFYSVGDVIYYRGTSYTCNFEHEASIENFPGDNGNVYDFWDILIPAGQEAGLQEKGDLLTYGLSRQIDYLDSTIFDGSTLGDTRLAIGEDEQVLSVNENLEIYWRNIQEDADAVFVAKNGIDATGRGTFQKPFRTIRYAAEYVLETYEAGSPVIIRVGTGKYEEIGPIIIPAGCAINGDELRSTTVIANPPLQEYQNDFNYVKTYLNHFETIALNVLTNIEILKTPGNTENQDTTGSPSGLDSVNIIIDLIKDFTDYVEFRIGNGNINPASTGTNEFNEVRSIAAQQLRNNRAFLSAEFLAKLRVQYPGVSFSQEKVYSDVASILRGLEADLTYPGNYRTLFSARRYVNAVNGSQLDSLFLMRDSTGLRDLTTGGLQGTLNPPGVFDLYQKPTGGACVAFDPGWGPDDETVWITNRSPYVQGVTNTGTGCVGQKIDGALHNGGLKSMVSNDFTQVLSDGIGVWVTNNARAELVSVFTYYCQIGYFAEDGGIIRATNGNNSYGRYGSIADGSDADEVPQNVTVFNRNNQAQVVEAFAGGTTDEILLFEYSHTGENYTTAEATITGAGANADVEFTDFRDDAIFQVRLTSPDGSSDPGGSGYLVRQGSAQETADASSTIKISQTDITQFLSEIEGMRIIITDGAGVGQYGYIDDFTFVTKEITVRRDSNGELGWDHIIPGTPLVSSFDLTTRYRIEPKIEVSHPGFATQNYDNFTNRTYIDAVYGDTTETFTNVSGSSKQIWYDDNGQLVTVAEIISLISKQFNGSFASNPATPFNIEGRTSGATATVTAISANTGTLIEVALSNISGTFVLEEEINIVYESGSGETFDDAAVPASFNVVRSGKTYNVTVNNAGAGYSVDDVIVVPGQLVGGATPANDLRITVTGVTSDSSNSIQTISTSGVAKSGTFVALTSSEFVRHSEDGITWTEVSLPYNPPAWKCLVSGNNKFIAIGGGPSGSYEDRYATSLNGETWTTGSFPLQEDWQDGVYGNGKFVIIARSTDIVLSSANGTTWTQGSIPDDTDGGGDSTTSVWESITYGKGKYVAVSVSDAATATSTDGVSWTRHDSALPSSFILAGGEARTHIDVTYGNNRFVATASSGKTAYSFDGITWYESTDLRTVVSDFLTFQNSLKYDNGVFFILGDIAGVATDKCFTSEDGVIWTERTLGAVKFWSSIAFGNVNGTSKWVALATAATVDAIEHISTGAKAKLRADIVTGEFQNIKIWDPGSGYASTPTITITDPNEVIESTKQIRLGDGVLSQPDFVNRGTGYRKSSSIISITGNGYADIVPESNTITLAGVRNLPGPGVQIRITGILDPTTEVPDDLFPFSGVEVFDLGDDGTGNDTRLVRFTVTPKLEAYMNVVHGTTVTLREKYSQCRISGHDFLDIGTGNFENTNYPEIYAGGNFFLAAPENEVYEANGGRVYYVSTDQDGNFRTGELFAVQQATGIVTISAEFFELDGLSELALGGVRLGGSGTVVNEFSTDPAFSADSNNVIPTQRAIATFLANRLSIGGESLEVNRLRAGRVILGGEANEIDIATEEAIQVPVSVTFNGTYEKLDQNGNFSTEQTNVSGTIISQMIFVRQFDETMQ